MLFSGVKINTSFSSLLKPKSCLETSFKIMASQPLFFNLFLATKDILQEVCKLTKKPVCIGFAAETQNLTENAKNKLKNKGCDAIILNDVVIHTFVGNSIGC
jgi:phosphopantothenoylcysteine synthetase/decarboxylase